jgi:hypothetical protein
LEANLEEMWEQSKSDNHTGREDPSVLSVSSVVKKIGGVVKEAAARGRNHETHPADLYPFPFTLSPAPQTVH